MGNETRLLLGWLRARSQTTTSMDQVVADETGGALPAPVQARPHDIVASARQGMNRRRRTTVSSGIHPRGRCALNSVCAALQVRGRQ